MRTVRCSSRLPGGGVCLPGVSAWGGSAQGSVCWWRGWCLPGGMGGVCQGGMGWFLPRGCIPACTGQGGCLPQCMLAYTPPLFGQNSWHTLVKTSPFRNSTSLYHIYITSLPCSSLLDQILEKLNMLSQLCLQITLIRSNIQWHHNELIRNRKKQG